MMGMRGLTGALAMILGGFGGSGSRLAQTLKAPRAKRMMEDWPTRTHSRGKGRGGPSQVLALHNSLRNSRPESGRHWHDRKDPAQWPRIHDAIDKRCRKAAKLERDTIMGARFNLAHRHPIPGTMRVAALNPRFIAR